MENKFSDTIAIDFKKMGSLVPVIAQDAKTLEVLMLAYMNEEAWEKTLATGEAHYFSRSRNEIWHKGATSGHTQKVEAIRVDCDADTILLLVEQKGGAACHLGYKSCFFRQLGDEKQSEHICSALMFDPKEIYK